MKLIDSYALWYEICRSCDDDIQKATVEDVLLNVLHAPIVDAQPVVHGKWVDESHEETKGLLWFKRIFQYRIVRCDQCGNFLDLDGVNAGRGDAKFCPNCGAKMDNGS